MMRYLKRSRGRMALIAVCGITVTVFCIEYLSYHVNSTNWPTFSDDENVVTNILFVADPQIQGEQNEHYLYGWISRWDADRYVQKNYQLARRHVSPDVVVFLGDLFDEGSVATDPEYRRYFQRINTIFDLPTSQNPSNVKYIFVPGDNDVGGEKIEPVDPVKVKWFHKSFGDIRAAVDFSSQGTSIQFLKMNLFMPNEYKSPLKGFEDVINGTQPDLRFIVSHVSLLSFMTSSVQQVIDTFRPNLIFSAHTHYSSYLRYVPGNEKKSVHIIHDFLLQNKLSTSDGNNEVSTSRIISEDFHSKALVKFNLKALSTEIEEILVPTCSYRMGASNMGYGAMRIYRNGTAEYAVLWLPSRFKQLYLYMAVYLIMKIILTPWLFFRIGTFLYYRIKKSRLVEHANEYVKIV